MSIKTLYKKPTKYYIKKCKTTTKTNNKQTKQSPHPPKKTQTKKPSKQRTNKYIKQKQMKLFIYLIKKKK